MECKKLLWTYIKFNNYNAINENSLEKKRRKKHSNLSAINKLK